MEYKENLKYKAAVHIILVGYTLNKTKPSLIEHILKQQELNQTALQCPKQISELCTCSDWHTDKLIQPYRHTALSNVCVKVSNGLKTVTHSFT